MSRGRHGIAGASGCMTAGNLVGYGYVQPVGRLGPVVVSDSEHLLPFLGALMDRMPDVETWLLNVPGLAAETFVTLLKPACVSRVRRSCTARPSCASTTADTCRRPSRPALNPRIRRQPSTWSESRDRSDARNARVPTTPEKPGNTRTAMLVRCSSSPSLAAPGSSSPASPWAAWPAPRRARRTPTRICSGRSGTRTTTSARTTSGT